MPTVQIQIVTWNSRQHLPRLFAGIRRQAVDYGLVVIDNASSDGTLGMLKNVLNVVSSPAQRDEIETTKITLIVNQQNRGFAAAHNQGFAICRSPFVLVLNPDVELFEGFLEKCLSVIQSDERLSAVAGKLYQQLQTCGQTGIIDSCGLKMKPWGQVVNIGEGQPDYGQFNNVSTIFGPSGACALYRLNVLRQIADKYGIFDERFGSYKEDVDLAWRLSRGGWHTIFVPNAVAYHPRAVRRDNRATRGALINQLSLRNHLLMLKKNLSWRDWWRIPLITGYELLKFIYILLFEKHNLKAYREAISSKL
jgi:GT2 family glycosyltransferase